MLKPKSWAIANSKISTTKPLDNPDNQGDVTLPQHRSMNRALIDLGKEIVSFVID